MSLLSVVAPLGILAPALAELIVGAAPPHGKVYPVLFVSVTWVALSIGFHYFEKEK